MLTPEIEIREAKAEDFNSIMNVEALAFGQQEEAQLTADLLRDDTAEPILSLLAYHKDEAVGHILFTRVYPNELDESQPLMHILAPLAIIPDYQKQGLGGALIQAGLERLKAMGSEIVFVLGHIEYYPKFGFIPDAKAKGYSAPYPIDDSVKDAWMIQWLTSNQSVIPTGKIVCADALNKPEYWVD